MHFALCNIVKICITSKFHSGYAEEPLNFFTTGSICFTLLQRLTRFPGVKLDPNKNFNYCTADCDLLYTRYNNNKPLHSPCPPGLELPYVDNFCVSAHIMQVLPLRIFKLCTLKKHFSFMRWIMFPPNLYVEVLTLSETVFRGRAFKEAIEAIQGHNLIQRGSVLVWYLECPPKASAKCKVTSLWHCWWMKNF
jgi:hypothetical protein